MRRYCLRYGYLSTYRELILIRQRQKTSNGKWVLDISPVFLSSSPSRDFHQSDQHKERSVSLREALFFIAMQSIKDYNEKKPPENTDQWHAPKKPDSKSVGRPGPSNIFDPTKPPSGGDSTRDSSSRSEKHSSRTGHTKRGAYPDAYDKTSNRTHTSHR